MFTYIWNNINKLIRFIFLIKISCIQCFSIGLIPTSILAQYPIAATIQDSLSQKFWNMMTQKLRRSWTILIAKASSFLTEALSTEDWNLMIFRLVRGNITTTILELLMNITFINGKIPMILEKSTQPEPTAFTIHSQNLWMAWQKPSKTSKGDTDGYICLQIVIYWARKICGFLYDT